jgi:transcription factor SPN1
MSDIASPASLHDDADSPVDVHNAPSPQDDDGSDDGLDALSDLSEVDEAQFEDFDPAAVSLDRPQAVDAENIRAIGVHKRKRPAGGDDAAEEKLKRKEAKRKKESRSKKPKRSRKTKEQLEAEEEDNFSGGEQLEGKRNRRAKGDGERRTRTVVQVEEVDENLTPDERRRKALDSAITNALRNPNQRRAKPAGIVSCSMADTWANNG